MLLQCPFQWVTMHSSYWHSEAQLLDLTNTSNMAFLKAVTFCIRSHIRNELADRIHEVCISLLHLWWCCVLQPAGRQVTVQCKWEPMCCLELFWLIAVGTNERAPTIEQCFLVHCNWPAANMTTSKPADVEQHTEIAAGLVDRSTPLLFHYCISACSRIQFHSNF